MTRTIPTLLLAALAATGAVTDARAMELNVRQGVDNASRNLIAKARLQAMLVDTGSRSVIDEVGGRSPNDCSTEIGNRSGGGSLLDRDAPVIVVGDVINLCR